MITLREAHQYSIFWGAVVTTGCAIWGGHTGDISGFFGGVGLGLILAYIPAATMGIATVAGKGQAVETVQETVQEQKPRTLAAVREFPNLARPISERIEEYCILTVGNSRYQVNCTIDTARFILRSIIQHRQVNLTDRALVGRERPFSTRDKFKAFLADLEARRLAEDVGTQNRAQWRLTTEGVKAFRSLE